MSNKKLSFAGKIAKMFVYNRPLAVLVFLSSIALGIFGFLFTPKQYNPEITLPAFQIQVDYPGANVEEVEEFVTKELEEKLRDIRGVDEIYTYSFDGGSSVAQVIFEVGENIEESKVKVQSKLSENVDLQAGNIRNPIIKSINPDDVAILTFGIQSEGLNQNELRAKAFDLVSGLRNIKGVANIDVHGGESPALLVYPDLGAMKIRNLSVVDITRAIHASNMRVRAGALEDGNRERILEVDGVLASEKDAKSILVAPGITLGDIAKVEEGYEEKNAFVSVVSQIERPPSTRAQEPPSTRAQEPQEMVFISVAKRKGENAITVQSRVLEFFEKEFEKDYLSNADWTLYRNEAAVAKKAISGLSSNLVTSIIIVSFILLLFLGLRSALTVAIAIPLTLSWVFFIGYLSGGTINRITLFALILSLGLLVDSATVVVENIFRHLHEGKEKKEAIILGVDEVGMGLLLSTLTSVIVFLPTSKISGMMGEYMGPLSFFVPVALLVSLGVAYILTPFLSDILLKSEVEKKAKKSKFELFFEKVSEKYGKWLSGILSSKKKQNTFLFGIFALLLIVLSFPIFQFVHFRMLPTADKAQYYLYIDAPRGTDSEKLEKNIDEVSRVLLEEEEVTSIQRFVGTAPVVDFNGLFKGANLRAESHQATLRVNLTQPEDRRISSEDLVAEMRDNFYSDAKIQEFYNEGYVLRFIEDPPGPPVQSTFVMKIKGEDADMRKKILEVAQRQAEKTEGLVDIDSSEEEIRLRTVLEVDHEKAMRSGVASAQIAETLRIGIDGIKVSQFHKDGQKELSFIELQFQKEDRISIENLNEVFVKNIQGESVPLISLVKTVDTLDPGTVIRDEGERATYLSAEMENRSIVYAVKDFIFFLLRTDELEKIGLERTKFSLFGFEYEDKQGDAYKIKWGGEFEMTLENFRDLGLAMMVAFVLIYALLVAQFRNFLSPALIMTTIPLGFIGILPGFALLDLSFGTFLTATSLIGFIALMGIVVNNAILFLEYVTQMQEEGENLYTALIDAGKTRLRPILLTSLTTVLGSLTIAGDPVWSGLAWSIVFGLSLSAVLTLGVFPVLLYRLKNML